jgi:catechol 2,3-dioxygenase-like lactoylglutathione lyase family enzyme
MSDTRKFALAALIVVGVFLLCCGTGMSSVAVGSIGVVLAIGGPILIFATTLRGNVRSYVFGTARVVEISPPPTVGPSGRGELGLVIHARGIDGVAVRVRDPAIPLNKWPQVGATLPVRSVSGSPRKTIVLWADVRTHEEATYDDRINPEYADLADEERGPDAAADDEFDHGPLPPDDTPTMTDIPPVPGTAERPGSVAVVERRRRPSPHPRKPVHDEAVAVAAEPVAQAVATTAEPAIAEPVDVVVEPQGVIAEPQDVVVEPQGVIAEPQDVVAEPQGVIAEPQEVVAESQDVVAEPQDVVAEPQIVAAEPQEVIAEPQIVAAEPEEVVDQPSATAAIDSVLLTAGSTATEDESDTAVVEPETAIAPRAPGPRAVEFDITPLVPAAARAATDLPPTEDRAEPETVIEPGPEAAATQGAEPEAETAATQQAEPGQEPLAEPGQELQAEPDQELQAEPDQEQQDQELQTEFDQQLQADPDQEQSDTATTTASEPNVDPHEAALTALLAPLEPLATEPTTEASVIGPGDVEREIIAPNPYATDHYVPVADPHPAGPRHRAPEPLDARNQEAETDPADVLEEELPLGAVAEFLPATPQRRPVPLEGVNGVSVTLIVSDLQRSLRFYRETLGLSEVDSNGSSAVLASGDARVVLRRSADMPPVDRRVVHLNLEVPDVYEAYERLKAEGVEFVHRPRVVPQGEQLDLCTATFRDPDGHAISLTRWELRR